MADEDLITVRNPELGEDSPTAEVRRDAFEQTWRAKGFVEVDPVQAKVGNLLGKPVDDVSKLSKDELTQAAALAGVSVDAKASKTDIAAQLSGALNPQEEEVANG